MSLTSPVISYQDRAIRDPRDEAVRQVKIGHWGDKAADWGGYIAANHLEMTSESGIDFLWLPFWKSLKQFEHEEHCAARRL